MLLVFRDVLDKQLIDRSDEPMGRVDSVMMELRDGEPPRLTEFHLGFVPLARRFGRRAESLMRWVHRRWSVRRSADFSIPCSEILDINRHHIKVNLDARPSVALDWERWMRRNIIDRLPAPVKHE
jgi:hypothetical protein